MKDCEFYQELISRMLDDDLNTHEETALKSHLISCAECQLVYEAFSGISGLIADDMEEVPDGLCENIMAELRRKEIKKNNRRLRPIFAAAACFAAVLLGVFGLKNTRLSSARDAAPMAGVQYAASVVTEDCAVAEEAAPKEAMRAAPAKDGGQNNMLFAAAAPVEMPCEAEAPAEADMFSAEMAEGEYILLPNSSEMEALRNLLSDGCGENEQLCRILYTVICEEDGSTIEIYECTDGSICYTDSLDGNSHGSSCSMEECEGFFTTFGGKG